MRSLCRTIFVLISAAYCQVLFQDDFNDGNADGWHEISMIEYDVVDGMYRMYGGYEENHGISYNGDDQGYMSTPDYSSVCRIVPQTGVFFGMLVRFSEENNYNIMIVLSMQHQSMRIYKWDWGDIYLLDDEPFAVEPDQEYWIRCEVAGEFFGGKAWTGDLWDEPDDWLVSASDTLSSPGSLALWCTGITSDVSLSCMFDDVQITVPISALKSSTWAEVKGAFL